jgi:hypothetical protein
MKERHSCRCWIAAFCSLSSLAFALAFDPLYADASCGDWLVHTGEMPGAHSREANDVTHRHDGSATSNRGRSSDDPLSQPCQGPFCRSAPSQPAPTAPSNVIPQVEKLALCGQVDYALAALRLSPFRDEANAHPLRGYPNLIDHPPRG